MKSMNKTPTQTLVHEELRRILSEREYHLNGCDREEKDRYIKDMRIMEFTPRIRDFLNENGHDISDSAVKVMVYEVTKKYYKDPIEMAGRPVNLYMKSNKEIMNQR